MTEQCGATFTTRDGESVTCSRTDRHLVHKDDMGRMAVHLPGGGALIASREGFVEGYVVKPGS